MADSPIPLATVAQFTEGPFGDLVAGFSAQALANLMLSSTRECESACDRRFSPFVTTETMRADSLDIEDALDSYVPLDPTSQLGFSRAQSLGSTLLVRHFWVREHPPRYAELWAGAVTGLHLFRSFSGDQSVDVSTVQFEPDTGHGRFQLGSFVPQGTTLQVVYSGGYQTMPWDLVEAGRFMAASNAVKQLNPADRGGHEPEGLRAEAMEKLAPYVRK
jgi:hypothetical protein